MSNGESVLAPTPIVRITSEQLEYLISRINRSKVRLATLKSSEQEIGTSAIGSGIAVGVNRLRKLLMFSTTSGGPYQITSTPNAGANFGFLVQGATQGPIVLPVDEWGWQLTQPWYFYIGTAGPSALYVVEVFGYPSIEEM